MNQRIIAEMAGVSTATVSNVINGNYSKVSEETRRRVEEIIRETGYRPTIPSRRKNGHRNIGVVVPFVSREADHMVNHYYVYSLMAIEEIVNENDCRLLLFAGHDMTDVLLLISDGILDGAVVVGIFEKDAKDFLDSVRIPVVFIDTCSEDPDMVTVGVDDYRGGFLMARYLIAKGHRKIAMAAPDYTEGVIRARVQGFIDACKESGVPFTEDDIFLTDTKFHSGFNVGQDIVLSGKGYTAIASLSDDMAMWMSAGIRQCGMRVPEDISVIGFDGIPEGDCFMPRLTSIDQGIRLKMEEAVKLLMRMMQGEIVHAHECLPVQIKEGDSVVSLPDTAAADQI